jgi:dynein heavy chain
MIEIYGKDCCTNCAEVHTVVSDFKETKVTITRLSKQITAALLLRVDKNQIYEGGVFEKRQADHRNALFNQFKEAYDRIMSVLRNIYKNFKDGSSEVLREWRSQISQIDKSIEQALKQSVKRSLQELSKAINGDSKTDPQTLFTVNLLLVEKRVTYDPTMVDLTHNVNVVAKDIITVVSAVPRIKGQIFDTIAPPAEDIINTRASVVASEAVVQAAREAAATAAAAASAALAAKMEETSQIKSYYEIISDDADILRIVVQIMNGMSSTATELQKYLSYWDKYKNLWDLQQMEEFIKRYAKSGAGPAKFDVDITKYKMHQSEINGENSTNVINFVRIDCNTLKDKFVNHCLQYQGKLTGLLNSNGVVEMGEIYALFQNGRDKLVTAPINLDELSQKIAWCKEIRENLGNTQGRFDPLRLIELYYHQ